MFTKQQLTAFSSKATPYYFYDLDLFKATLSKVKKHGTSKGYHIHYALKANSHPRILDQVIKAGLSADCVSGGEVERAIECGFSPDKIAFAGVGKRDIEIEIGLKNNILCFNVESVQELEVINELASKNNRTAKIALRINPNVDANTHKYITTGLKENKFGINEKDLPDIFELLPSLKHIELIGIHFHIGSQIEELEPFKKLCLRANELNAFFENKGHKLSIINVGGGFGINYSSPNGSGIPDFEKFFGTFEKHLQLKPHQQLHFELGRSVVGQSGSLITRVLYTKTGIEKNFAIIDAGMTELIRPALYQAKHEIQIISNQSGRSEKKYDIVGPICESSDVFRTDYKISELKRGDLLAIRSCGAYGEVMKSRYNLRHEIGTVFSDELG
ncbi:MAG: diaminopimelate decarboxylase [Balneola sp.]